MRAMDESAYHNACDELFAEIEAMLDETGADFHEAGGVLEVEDDNGDKIIISRQTPLREIWVAEKKAGRHFRLQNGEWSDTIDGRALMPYLRGLVE